MMSKHFAQCLLMLVVCFASSDAERHLRSHRKLVRALNTEARIDNQYIVVFRESVSDVHTKMQSLLNEATGSNLLYEYDSNIKGAALGHVPDSLLSSILNDDDVAYVEEDHVIHAYSSTVQMNPPWGIDRLDSSSLPLDSAYRYQYTGRGVKVFVVDSGIRSTHQDFGGRVVCGMSVFSGTSCQDGQGHGTHVAGTVGGTAYGVAKDAEIVAVRVLDNRGDGSISGLISALDYIRRQKSSSPRTPMVVNLSLGSDDPSPSLDAAVDSTVAAGLVVVVAAGNYVGNACSTSPASAKNAITVAATDSQDGRLGMSNFGSCVSIFAPGSSITSAWSSSDTSSSTISGTSMAAPHVAGVAALYLEANPQWTPAQVWAAMRNDAVRNIVQNAGARSPNLLVSIEKLNQRLGGGRSTDGSPSSTSVGDGECRKLFSSCSDSGDCCSGGCTFRLCWLW